VAAKRLIVYKIPNTKYYL